MANDPLDVKGETRKPLTGARYYDPSKNPDAAALPGVPLRDLTDAEFEALPLWLQYSVDAQPFYRKTAPKAAAKEE